MRLSSFKTDYIHRVNVSFWILLFNSFHREEQGAENRAKRAGQQGRLLLETKRWREAGRLVRLKVWNDVLVLNHQHCLAYFI